MRGRERDLAREFEKERKEVMRGREKKTAREWKVSLKRDRMGNCERVEDLEEGGDRNRERIQERNGSRISEENDSGSQRGDEIRNKKLKTQRTKA